ncbi:hypothetical protein PUN28_012049 [Cardiocondyla obscurior]|uniref:Uncharacterized protein n=1 Tax=Cardiocondyla obscurior TaxID=286306 RepID=A0AAW2FE16_9HYME
MKNRVVCRKLYVTIVPCQVSVVGYHPSAVYVGARRFVHRSLLAVADVCGKKKIKKFEERRVVGTV